MSKRPKVSSPLTDKQLAVGNDFMQYWLAMIRTAIGSQLARYLLVGLLVFWFYFFLLYVFIQLLGVYYPIGVTIAYALAACAHFLLNRTYTFKAGRGLAHFQMAKFMVLLGINYGVTLAVVSVAVERLGLSPYLGAIAGILATTLIGFVATKYWVFKS